MSRSEKASSLLKRARLAAAAAKKPIDDPEIPKKFVFEMSNSNEKPILFSAPMIRAIIEDRKTQTRRVVLPHPFTKYKDGAGFDSWYWSGGNALVRAGYGVHYVHTDRKAMELAMLKVSRFKIGTRLWCRETWAVPYALEKGKVPPIEDVIYRGNPRDESAPVRWRPSIFMPRSASRITLEITDVDVQRIQDITPADARAEGSEGCLAYSKLWNLLNLPRPGCSWTSNPWVYKISFRKL